MLQDYEDWMDEDLNVALDLPGVGKKGDHSDARLKALALESLDTDYHEDTWTQVLTGGSTENAVRSGGGGVLVKFPDGRRESRSIPTGRLSTYFRLRAECFTMILTA